MKRLVGVAVVVIAALSPAFAADMPAVPAAPAEEQRWGFQFNTEVRYFSSTSNKSSPPVAGTVTRSRGDQIYVPYGLELNGRPSDDLKVDLLMRSGWIWSRQSISGVGGTVTGESRGWTDTSFSGTATYSGWAGLQPYASLTVNVPTGRSTLLGNATLSKLDPDVIDAVVFGEGTNVGPTVGLSIPISTSLVVAAAAGYTWRGQFDQEGAILFGVQAINHLDPGDVFTATGQMAYQGERLSVSASVAYSTESMTTRNDANLYKAGDRIIVAGAIGYAWNDNWTTKLSGSYSHFGKLETLFFNGAGIVFGLERFNSNSDVVKLALDTSYTEGKWAIGPSARFIYRNHNGYDPTAFQFVPAKTVWSAGGVAQYGATQHATFMLRVEHMWLHENAQPDEVNPVPPPIPGTAIPDVISRAWLVSLGGLFRF